MKGESLSILVLCKAVFVFKSSADCQRSLDLICCNTESCRQKQCQVFMTYPVGRNREYKKLCFPGNSVLNLKTLRIK